MYPARSKVLNRTVFENWKKSGFDPEQAKDLLSQQSRPREPSVRELNRDINSLIRRASSLMEIKYILQHLADDMEFTNLVACAVRIPKLLHTASITDDPENFAHRLMDRLCYRLEVHLDECGTQELSRWVWALGRIKYPVHAGLLAGMTDKLLQNGSELLVHASPSQLSQLVSGFSRLGHQHAELWQVLQTSCEAAMTSMELQHICDVLVGLASAKWCSPALMAGAASRLQGAMSMMSHKQLAMVLWAYAQSRTPADSLFAAAADVLKPQLASLAPVSLASLAWSYATLYPESSLFTELLRIAPGMLVHFSSDEAAILLQAMATSHNKDEVLCRLIPDLIKLRGAGSMKPHRLTMALSALRVLKPDKPAFYRVMVQQCSALVSQQRIPLRELPQLLKVFRKQEASEALSQLRDAAAAQLCGALAPPNRNRLRAARPAGAGAAAAAAVTTSSSSSSQLSAAALVSLVLCFSEARYEGPRSGELFLLLADELARRSSVLHTVRWDLLRACGSALTQVGNVPSSHALIQTIAEFQPPSSEAPTPKGKAFAVEAGDMSVDDLEPPEQDPAIVVPDQ